jgi:hypothetical protein
MGEPIKIVVTAQTAAAATELQQFAQQTTGGFKQAEQAAEKATSMFAQNRAAVMELGHSARAMAEGLAFGMNPLRIAMLEAPRISQAMAEASDAMRAKIMSFLPILGGVGVALAAGAVLWHYYGEALVDPTKRARELADSLDKVPDLLKKIQIAQRAGDITGGMAQKFQDMLTGATKLYNVTTHSDAYGGHAGTFQPSGTMFGESVPDLSTDPYQRNRAGQITGQRQEANETDVTSYVQYQMKHAGATDANEKTKMASQAAVELQEEELRLQRDSEIAAQKTIDRLKDRNALELRGLEILKQEMQAGGKWNPEEEAKYQAAVKNSQASLQQSLAEEQARVDKEAEAEQTRRVQQQAESATKIRETEAKNAKDDLQAVEDRITADQDAAGNQRGQLIQQEYQLRIDAAQRAFFSGEIDEEEYTHLCEDAAHKRTEAEKEYNAQLERTAQLKKQIAQMDAEAQLQAVDRNPLLTNQEKSQQSLPLWQSQLSAVNADIGSQQSIIGANPADSQASLEAQEKKNELLAQQADLQEKIVAAENEDNFGYQLDQVIVKLQNTGTIAQQTAAAFGSAWTEATNSISQNLSKVIQGTETWRKACINIYNSILNEVVTSFVKMAVQWVLQHTVMAAVSALFHTQDVTQTAAATQAKVGIHGAGEGQMTLFTMVGSLARQGWHLAETVFQGLMVAMRVAVHTAGEIACTAVTYAQAVIRALYHMIVAAIAAMESEASVPYVGVILGIAAAAAIIAAGVGLMGGFEAGGYTGAGPSGEVAGVVHRGEFVIPAHAVNAIGLGNLEAMRSGNHSGGMTAAGGAPANGGKTSVYTFMDSRQMADHLQKNDDHEKWVVDVMGRNIHKFR